MLTQKVLLQCGLRSHTVPERAVPLELRRETRLHEELL